MASERGQLGDPLLPHFPPIHSTIWGKVAKPPSGPAATWPSNFGMKLNMGLPSTDVMEVSALMYFIIYGPAALIASKNHDSAVPGAEFIMGRREESGSHHSFVAGLPTDQALCGVLDDFRHFSSDAGRTDRQRDSATFNCPHLWSPIFISF